MEIRLNTEYLTAVDHEILKVILADDPVPHEAPKPDVAYVEVTPNMDAIKDAVEKFADVGEADEPEADEPEADEPSLEDMTFAVLKAYALDLGLDVTGKKSAGLRKLIEEALSKADEPEADEPEADEPEADEPEPEADEPDLLGEDDPEDDPAALLDACRKLTIELKEAGKIGRVKVLFQKLEVANVRELGEAGPEKMKAFIAGAKKIADAVEA